MANRVGQQLGNYRLTQFLGQGGFAEIYLGLHLHLETQAAIKVQHTPLSHEDVERFRTEARTVARLEHPHIVRLLEFGVEDETAFLVMSYAPHGSLRQRYPKGTRVPLSSIVRYVKQIAAALQYAHDAHLIHRDLKPENLLLGRHHEVLLSDFGLVLALPHSGSLTTKEMAGTLPYTLTSIGFLSRSAGTCPRSPFLPFATLLFLLRFLLVKHGGWGVFLWGSDGFRPSSGP